MLDRLLSSTDIAASGMAAERQRMVVGANNLANAHSTRGTDGQPYRRQQVVFQALVDERSSSAPHGMGGVRVVGIEAQAGPLPKLHIPGHPDADVNGYVTMPNVSPTLEMVDMITSTRAYEANLKALKSFREMAEQALELLRAN